jgi:CHAT domain-containing protein
VYRLLSDINFQQHNWDNALNLAKGAAGLYQMSADTGHQMAALTMLGVMEVYRNHSEEANLHLRQALDIAEGPPAASIFIEPHTAATMKNAGYNQMVQFLIKQGQPQEAFLWAERRKSTLIRDALIAEECEPVQGLTSEELQRERLLRTRLAESQARLSVLFAPNRPVMPRGEASRSMKALKDITAELETFTTALYKKHGALGALRATKAPRLEEIAQFLPADTALLEFAPATAPWADNLVLFCVTVEAGRATLTHHIIRDTEIPLKARVADFRDAVADPKRDWQGPAAELYQLLLAEAAPRFAKKRRLLIGPEGPLWSLPVNALLDENGRCMAERFEISYVAGALGAQIALRALPGTEGLPAPSTVAGTSITPPKSLSIQGATPGQAAMLKTMFPDAEAHPNPSLSSNARLLHIAAPLTFEAAAPLESSLGLTPATAPLLSATPPVTTSATTSPPVTLPQGTRPTVPEDESPLLSAAQGPAAPSPSSVSPLTTRQIMGAYCNANLVALSPSGRVPEDSTGAAWELLHWAFLNASVSTQVMVTQSISDSRAAPFWKAFYTRVKQGQSAGNAHRAAVNALRKDRSTAHPINWAPFLVFGDGNAKM